MQNKWCPEWRRKRPVSALVADSEPDFSLQPDAGVPPFPSCPRQRGADLLGGGMWGGLDNCVGTLPLVHAACDRKQGCRQRYEHAGLRR